MPYDIMPRISCVNSFIETDVFSHKAQNLSLFGIIGSIIVVKFLNIPNNCKVWHGYTTNFLVPIKNLKL